MSNTEENLKYQIALSLLPGIGDIRAKKLVSFCGSVEAVFREKRALLEKIPGIGLKNIKQIIKPLVFDRAEEEIRFIRKNKIQPMFYLDESYPKRLLHCEDSPILLYFKGECDLNRKKVISIVGTRDATAYGRELCEKLVADLAGYSPLIVSGLAYGIDLCAHRAAMQNNLDTIGVLAHGLDKIYPAVHRSLAEKMTRQGGLLSDFCSQTIPDRENFPRRNRIVAGMADATIVIESKKDGGSLITADIANSYNRDVFAFPGRIGDLASEGCNTLIKQNKAALIQSGADLVYIMGWEEKKKGKSSIQKKLFVELNPDEEKILALLKDKDSVYIDDLSLSASMPVSKVSSLLLNLEFSGLVCSMPGKMYKVQ
jgi:DNA processing protein